MKHVAAQFVFSLALLAGVTLAAKADTLINGCTVVSSPTAAAHTSCVNLDLSNADFSGYDLSYANFSNSILISANLTSSNMSFATFANANLQYVNLSSATLNSTSFDNANLYGSNLSNTDLSSVSLAASKSDSPTHLHAVNLINCPLSLPAGMQCLHNNLIGSAADLTNADLSNVDLSGIDVSESIFTGTNLAGANMATAIMDYQVYGAYVAACPLSLPANWRCINNNLLGPNVVLEDWAWRPIDLTYADLSGVDLSNAWANHVDFTGSDLSAATLTNIHTNMLTGCPAVLPVDWQCINGYLVGPTANLTQDNLSNLDLRTVNFTAVYMQSINMQNSNLTNQNLAGLYMHAAQLAGAQLINVNFSLADLTGADLSGADLTGADFSGAIVDGMQAINLVACPAVLPNAGWTCGPLAGASTPYNFIAPTANTCIIVASPTPTIHSECSGAFMDSVSMQNIDFSYADLTYTHLVSADFAFGIFLAADLSGANLGSVNFQYANLEGAKLNNSNSYNTFFQIANMKSADLSGSDMTYAQFFQSDLTGTNISNVNMTGSDLSATNLNQTNLTSTNLSTAKLQAMKARNVTACPSALPSGWWCWRNKKGYWDLIGPEANLSNADFSGQDLSGAVPPTVMGGGL